MRLLAAAAFLISFLAAAPVKTQEAVDVQLLNGGYAKSSSIAMMGIEVDLPPGWHTYWKTAGEGGFAPEIDTSKSDNLASFEIAWPAPERIDTSALSGNDGFETNGYVGKVVLPVIVKPIDPAAPVNVDLSLRLYACKDFCTAFERTFVAAILPGEAHEPPQSRIGAWLRKVPRSKSATLSITPPELDAAGNMVVGVTSTLPLDGAWLHVSNADNTPYRVTSTSLDKLRANYTVIPSDGSFVKSDRIEIVATSGGQSVSGTYDIPRLGGISSSILVTALLGGLILNLMPCVFPVLSLKMISLASPDAVSARKGFAASSLGIVVSFVALGAILAAMKAAGAQIGWGIQFQSPLFIGTMTVVTLLFALGLAGAFEIAIPGKFATSVTKLTSGHGFWASFAQGFAATLLATPCSAPLIGSAVGFALGRDASSILPVFATMGIGMSLPYALFAVVPGMSKMLPAPGRWMTRLKSLLALALFATSGWLFLTLGSIWKEEIATIAVFLPAVAVVGAASSLAYGVMVGRVGFALAASVAFATPAALQFLPATDGASVAWKRFSPEAVAREVGLKSLVIVNVTAQWCLTCKVNDTTTWSDPATVDLVNRDAVAFKADWTRPDPVVSRYLKDHGRYGIPFTLVFREGSSTPEILPELLTPRMLEQAISR